MTNREIIEWWDSKTITERVTLRLKYNFNVNAVLDVDDYRIIYEAEFKP